MKKTILAFAVATVGLSGCMTYDPYTGEEKTSSATKGSIIGAIGGAAVGAAGAPVDGSTLLVVPGASGAVGVGVTFGTGRTADKTSI